MSSASKSSAKARVVVSDPGILDQFASAAAGVAATAIILFLVLDGPMAWILSAATALAATCVVLFLLERATLGIEGDRIWYSSRRTSISFTVQELTEIYTSNEPDRGARVHIRAGSRWIPDIDPGSARPFLHELGRRLGLRNMQGVCTAQARRHLGMPS